LKKSAVVFLIFFLFPLLVYSQCTKDNYSGLSYPDSFDGWIRGAIKDLEAKNSGYGTMADYDLNKLHVTLYFYNEGLSSIDFSNVENNYNNFCLEVKKFESQGIYSNVVAPVKLPDLVINEDVKVLNAYFEFTYKGNSYGSFYFNTAMKNHLVKVRFSMPVSLLEEKKSTVNDFVKELYKRIIECN
jgi:hypothetical protein